MTDAVIFIYAKDGKIKALDIEQTRQYQSELIKEGWIHTQTLDTCAWIQYIHNDCNEVDLMNEIKSLRVGVCRTVDC